jgi:Flp pilus assembly pilin Flp
MLMKRDERGQATAEYALVLLGAAMVALLVFAWADESKLIGKLLDGVIDNVIGRIPKP